MNIEGLRCNHNNTEIRRRILSNGSVTWREQCLVCGAGIRQIKSTDVPTTLLDNPVDFDLNIANTYWNNFNELIKTARKEKQENWRDRYNKYLLSPQWKTLRMRVLGRANGVCEGCMSTVATEVHHLTYARVGREMLFDLVAVCESCHRLIHQDQDAAVLLTEHLAEPWLG